MKTVSRFLSSLSDTINKLTEMLLVFLLLALSILMVAAVFYRYVLNDSIYWSGEVSRILLVFISFLGSAVAYKHKAHIGIDIFIERLSGRKQKVLNFTIELAFLLFWLLVFIESFKLMPIFLMQTTATLEIPYAYFFSAVPISSLLWIIHILNNIFSIVVSVR